MDINNQNAEVSEEKIRKYIHEKAKILRDTAFLTGKAVPSEEIAALERLERTSKIYIATKEQLGKKSWISVALFGLILLFVTILYITKVPQTDIELDAKLTDLRFVLTESWPIIEKMVIGRELAISEVREVQLSHSEGKDAQNFTSSDEAAVRLLLIEDGNSQGTITFTDLKIPVNTQIWVSLTDVANQYRFVFIAPDKQELTINLGLQGIIEFIMPKVKERFVYIRPGAVLITSASNRLILDLMLSNEQYMSLPSQLAIKNLTLTRIDQSIDFRDPAIKEISSIQSGILYFASFAKKEYVLRTSERLNFNQSRGIIRKMNLQQEQISIQFYGTVSGMTAGWEQNQQDLMPTRLEWIRTRSSFTSISATALSLFTVCLGILKWWRTKK